MSMLSMLSKLKESKNISLTDVSSIELAIASNKHLDSNISEIIKSNHPIDVSKAMTKLASVSKILNLAYAGSKGFKCSTSTIKILSKYQSMIHDSNLACSTFVSACLSSLKYHKCAITLAESNKLEEALTNMEKCSKLASKMMEASDELAKKADELCRLSEEALTAASDDENISREEKRRIADSIRNSKARQAELEAKSSSLFKQINEIKEERQKVDKKIDKEASREDMHQIVDSVVSPVIALFKNLDFFSKFFSKTNLNNNDRYEKKETSRSEKLYQKEKELTDLEKDLHKEEIISNMELAKIVTILKDLTIKDNHLEASIVSLELAIKALGKIKTTFELTRQFWIGVKNHCDGLSDLDIIKNYAKADLKNEVIAELRSSGLQWLSLGKLNYMAKEAIENVSKQADGLLYNLPTKSEALRIVQDEAEDLMKNLEF